MRFFNSIGFVQGMDILAKSIWSPTFQIKKFQNFIEESDINHVFIISIIILAYRSTCIPNLTCSYSQKKIYHKAKPFDIYIIHYYPHIHLHIYHHFGIKTERNQSYMIRLIVPFIPKVSLSPSKFTPTNRIKNFITGLNGRQRKSIYWVSQNKAHIFLPRGKKRICVYFWITQYLFMRNEASLCCC